MNHFKETMQRFFSGSYSENDLKNLFFWLNSERGQDEIGQLFDESRNFINFDDDIPVDSEKMLEHIRKGIQRRKSLKIKRTFNRLLPYAVMFILVLGSIFFFSHKKINVEEVINSRTVTVITKTASAHRLSCPIVLLFG